MQQNLVNDMLKNIPDPNLREQYGKILSGTIVALVRCMSDTCNGHVIAHIDDTGRVSETEPVLNKKGKGPLYTSGLEGSRYRFDGQMGFRCYCGNNSILCEEEKGIITPAIPSQQDLMTIAERLQQRPPALPEVGPRKTVDGFVIEKIKV